MPENFIVGVAGSCVFALLGILFLIAGFKVFDLLLKKIDFQDELKGNAVAIAIVIGSFFLALSHIIAAVVH